MSISGTCCTGSRNGIIQTAADGVILPLQSWYAYDHLSPLSPLELIAFASILATVGDFQLRTDLIAPPGGWGTDALELRGAPVCYALGTDDEQKVQNAAQWNFAHKTWYESAAIAPPLQKLLFLRAGREWKMSIPFTGTGDATDLYLTFRDNLATRGDDQASVQCLAFENIAFGEFDLSLTVLVPGRYSMALIYADSGNDYRIYESEWIVVS